MDRKKVHVGRRAVLRAALLALVVVASSAVLMLQTPATPVVRTIRLGVWTGPWTGPLAVDETTGHAFVAISDSGGGGHSRIEMVDAATGAVLRTIAMPGWVGAVDEQAARIVVASSEGVRVLDARNGALVRVVHLSPTPNAFVVDARVGRIYVAGSGATSCTNQTCTTSDGALAVLDARTGRLLHTTTLHGQGWTALALDGRAHHLIVTSIGYTGRHESVSVFDSATGRLVRRISLTSVVWRPPLVDEVTGRAFFVATNPAGNMNASSLAVLDTRTGQLVRSLPIGAALVDLAVDEGMGRVFATVGTGSVRVLDARSGRLLRTIPIGLSTTAVAVDGRRGRLYVTNAGAVDASGNFVAPGTLSVLDERSARVLRTVAVGVNPLGLVLDRRAGRLFVVNAGNYGPVRPADPWAWVPYGMRRWLPFLPQHAPSPRRIPASVTVLDTSRL